jgi:hypothetical protein
MYTVNASQTQCEYGLRDAFLYPHIPLMIYEVTYIILLCRNRWVAPVVPFLCSIYHMAYNIII